jgi:YHS domain-containing protein
MMKTSTLTLLMLALQLGGCEKKSQTAQPAASAPASSGGAVGDNATIPKLAIGSAAKCPVTGEDFTVKENTVQVTYDGKRYAFCCADCQPTFAKNPAKYAAK